MMCIDLSGNSVFSVELGFSVVIASGCQANCQTFLQDFLVFMLISIILIQRTPCILSHSSISYYREVIWVLKFELSLFCFATDVLYDFEQPMENLVLDFHIFSYTRCSFSQGM